MFEPVLFSIKLHNKKPLWTLVQVIPLYFGSKQEILTPMVSHLSVTVTVQSCSLSENFKPLAMKINQAVNF